MPLSGSSPKASQSLTVSEIYVNLLSFERKFCIGTGAKRPTPDRVDRLYKSLFLRKPIPTNLANLIEVSNVSSLAVYLHEKWEIIRVNYDASIWNHPVLH